MSTTPAATIALAGLLRDLRAVADWGTDADTLALIDGAKLGKAGAALRTWADNNTQHTGSGSARAFADLVAQVAAQDLPLFDCSRDVRDAVRAAARIVQLAGRVPATNDTPRAVLATIYPPTPSPAVAARR